MKSPLASFSVKTTPPDCTLGFGLAAASQRGSTLVIAMCLIAIFAIVIGAAFEYTSGAGHQDSHAAGYARTAAAADGYADIVYGRFCAWVEDHNNLCPGNTDIAALDTTVTPSRPAILNTATPIVPPAGSSLTGYQMVVNAYTPKLYPVLPDDSQPAVPDYPNYADAFNPLTQATYGPRCLKYQTRTPLPYDKTKGTATYTYKLIVTAAPTNPGYGDSGPVTIVRYIQETVANPFSYARFNNGSLQDGADGRIYTGPLYAAYNLTLTGVPVTINGQLNYVQNFYGNNGTLNDPSNLIFPVLNVPLGSTMSTVVAAGGLRQTSMIELIPNLASTIATLPDANGNPSRANTVESGSNNFSLRELIEPPVTTVVDPPAIAQNRIYNMADVRIHVSGTAVTVTKVDHATFNSNNDNVDIALSPTDPLYLAVKNSITQTTNSFYDTNLSGPGVPLKTTDINVGTISTYLTANPTAGVTTIYVWDDTPAPYSTPQFTPVVRLYNGGVLPAAGLSFGSDNGFYIKGDWNTGTQLSGATNFSNGTQIAGTTPPSNTQPASQPVTMGQNVATGYTASPSGVFGDSITQLTQSWKDANSTGTRNGISTTANIVFGQGTGAADERQPNDIFTDDSHASIRFLENWQGGRRTSTGSEMHLWHSRYYYNFGTTWFNINTQDTLFSSGVTRGLFPKWGSPLFSLGRFYRFGGIPTSAL